MHYEGLSQNCDQQRLFQRESLFSDTRVTPAVFIGPDFGLPPHLGWLGGNGQKSYATLGVNPECKVDGFQRLVNRLLMNDDAPKQILPVGLLNKAMPEQFLHDRPDFSRRPCDILTTGRLFCRAVAGGKLVFERRIT